MKGEHPAIIDGKQESVIPNGIRFQGFWAGKGGFEKEIFQNRV